VTTPNRGIPGEWTAQQCAEAWGVQLKTWHSYVARDQAPKPVRRIGRTPMWNTAEVTAARDRRTPRMRKLRLPALTDILGAIDASYDASHDQGHDGEFREKLYRDAVTARNALASALWHLADVAEERAAQSAVEAGPDDNYSPNAMRAHAARQAYEALGEDLRSAADQLDAHILVHPFAD
jgi:hypothetical protein